MSRKMLIDAAHPEETRVVVVDNTRVEDFDFESATKKQIRGNIYLAKVTRVEPSLQAAFVEYGGNKHGFLAFNEIHPDYYQIPHADREALRESEAAIARESDDPDPAAEGEDGPIGGDDDEIAEEAARQRRQLLRKYKIQEVIKRRQVMLVQVAKEERGNKGAALTTYLSLAGRYCVLMPNTPRGGGISRKITNASDRRRLKEAVAELKVTAGLGLIIRTAGAARTKAEIKRDYEYLVRLWETIREQTLKSSAPSLIYEEGNLVKRAIRDLYDKDIEEILVEGEDAYKEAKAFIRMLMPSHAKKVQHYKSAAPLFLRHQVESQLEAIYSPTATLKSGGYIVINPTEALVSIDVNSGKSTKERNIEQTALRTNLEAAEEVARQMRLRDLAGLLVIDFIDMDENKNVRAVEKKMKDVLKRDRARLQVGRISQFGLMELSRQRRRTSLIEGSTETCPHCNGTGHIRSIESSALVALRTLEEEGVKGKCARVSLACASEVALYLLNEKREHLRAIEERFDMKIVVAAVDDLIRPDCKLERLETRREAARAEAEASTAQVVTEPADVLDSEAEPVEPAEDEETEKPSRRRGRRGGRNRRRDAAESDADTDQNAEAETDEDDDEAADTRAEDASEDDGDRPRKRRRRGRRGGRGRRRRTGEDATTDAASDEAPAAEEGAAEEVPAPEPLAVIEPDAEPTPFEAAEPAEAVADEKPKRRRRKRAAPEADAAQAEPPQAADEAADTASEDAAADDAPKPKRRRTRKKAGPEAELAAEAQTDGEAAADAPAAEDKPKRRRTTRRKAAPSETPAAETPEAPETETVAAAEPAPAAEPETAAGPASEDAEEDGRPRRRGWWQRSGKIFGIGG